MNNYMIITSENGTEKDYRTSQESFAKAEEEMVRVYQRMNLNGYGINWEILSITLMKQ